MTTLIYSEQQNRIHLTKEQMEIILNGCNLNQRGPQKELYRNYYGYAMSIALRYSSSHYIAAEMTNDTFLKIYASLRNSVPRQENTVASFTGWFNKVLVSVCINHLKK